MNEIIEMAEKAGFTAIWKKQYIISPYGFEDANLSEELVAFAKLVAAKERGACAELCDSEKRWWDGMSHAEKDIYQAIDNISALIRARGEA